MQLIKGSGTPAAPGAAPGEYVEHIRSDRLSAGTYLIPAGGVDNQTPHREDEIYLVTAGKARVVTGSGEADVEPGDLIFVPAGEPHRFVDVTEDLALLVFFAPAFTGRT
ncbi:cupin domain-containing protein [Actinokineospora sp. HUAS TT18]|uniref:cupin domain-containing protein n=1 Tax=Actinokineospora sp. HUAS TT18 TaxID=3447451 RepID=UPI003F5262CD